MLQTTPIARPEDAVRRLGSSKTNEEAPIPGPRHPDLLSSIEANPDVSTEEVARIHRAREYLAGHLEGLTVEYPETASLTALELVGWLRDFNSPL